MNRLKNIFIWIAVIGALVFLFPNTFIVTPVETNKRQTEGEYLIEITQLQRDGNFEILYEQLQSKTFTRDKVREISDCADEELIYYIKSFPEKFNNPVPEFNTPREQNEYFETLYLNKLEDILIRSTNMCMSRVMNKDE